MSKGCKKLKKVPLDEIVRKVIHFSRFMHVMFNKRKFFVPMNFHRISFHLYIDLHI